MLPFLWIHAIDLVPLSDHEAKTSDLEHVYPDQKLEAAQLELCFINVAPEPTQLSLFCLLSDYFWHLIPSVAASK